MRVLRVLGLVCTLALGAACDSSDDVPATCGLFPDPVSSPYVLPYSVGETYQILQGNCGSFTHLRETPLEFAYDFRMPSGTPVRAARGGTIAGVEASVPDGSGSGFGNFVAVVHSDGTVARYLHLQQFSVTVLLGDDVTQGTLLGLSDNTGFSTEPHLHFDVAECLGSGCPTLPVTFSNTRPNPVGLIQGLFYTAEPYPAR